jgi:hypothetical protein
MAFRRKPGGLPYPVNQLSGAPLSQSSPIGPFGDSRLSDCPRWGNKYQGGALELPVNVALLMLGAIVVRAPLYINTIKSPPPQIEHTVNVAALSQVNNALIIQQDAEPIYTKRLPPQIDVFPNLAALKAPVVYVPASTPEPGFYKRLPPQVEISPNVVVCAAIEPPKSIPSLDWVLPPHHFTPFDQVPNLAALVPVLSRVPAPLLDLPVKAKLWPVPEVFPNLSAKTETVSVTRAPFYTPYKAIRWIAPDLPINVALKVTTVAPTFPPLVEPSFTRRPAPQIDLFPNLAASGTPVNINALVVQQEADPYYYPRKPPQIDIYTNVAVMLKGAAGNISDFDDLPHAKWTTFDLFPNIAAKVGPPAPYRLALVEPVYSKRYPPQIDVLPNLAALAPPEVHILIEPIDPWIAKRLAPQVEIFPNQAIYVAPIHVKIPAPIDPLIWLKPNQQPYELPNIAITQPYRVVYPQWLLNLPYRNFTVWL